MMHEPIKNDKLIYLVYAGLFAALTALLTAAFHIPVANGYIHCGDAVIYLAAAMLPMPYAIGASAVGGAVADLLSGYPVYVLPTFLIKGLLALTFSLIGGNGMLSRKRFLSMGLCGLLSVAGYYLTAVLLYGGWAAQIPATVPGNVIQALASAAVYTVLAAALQKVLPRKSRIIG